LMLEAKVTPINLLALPKVYKDINEVNIPDAIREQLKDAKPKAIIAFEMFYPMLKQAAEELRQSAVILTGPQDYLPWPLRWLYPLKAKRSGKYVRVDYAKEKRNGINIHCVNIMMKRMCIEELLESYRYNRFIYVKPDDVVQLQYTAGTTGVPKGVMLTNENLAENSAQARETLGGIVTDGEETVLGILPFFHIYGMTISLLTSLFRGWTIVLVPDPKDVKRWVGWIKKYKATIIPCVPRIYELLTNQYPETV
ncbi:MAG: AMP-binding protein, partial [Patescibacteria group bacterium]